MFTHKDIETRSIFVINCLDHEKGMRVSSGELLLEEHNEDGKAKTLTKFPFQKILALMVIGHITVTTPLIEKCRRYGVALVVVKPNLRPVFYWSDSAESNFLLRQRQHLMPADDITIASTLVRNKIGNQRSTLQKTRRRDSLTIEAISQCTAALNSLMDIDDYNKLMGIEGVIAKTFFTAYYQDFEWNGRHPRIKCDALNVTLDIGYTMLFNFVECFLRLYGFDLYVGVYHRLWFKRKSLVCDLVEPFRCIIDHATLLAFNRKQFAVKDFAKSQNEYYLKRECTAQYYRVFTEALIAHKQEIFKYIQQYYRCFMGRKSVQQYPLFQF